MTRGLTKLGSGWCSAAESIRLTVWSPSTRSWHPASDLTEEQVSAPRRRPEMGPAGRRPPPGLPGVVEWSSSEPIGRARRPCGSYCGTARRNFRRRIRARSNRMSESDGCSWSSSRNNRFSRFEQGKGPHESRYFYVATWTIILLVVVGSFFCALDGDEPVCHARPPSTSVSNRR